MRVLVRAGTPRRQRLLERMLRHSMKNELEEMVSELNGLTTREELDCVRILFASPQLAQAMREREITLGLTAASPECTQVLDPAVDPKCD